MKLLSAAQLERLRAALRALETPPCRDRNPRFRIAHLKAHFGAKVTLKPTGNSISCAGVRASCTWSEDDGLLAAWTRLARRHVWAADTAIKFPTAPAGLTGRTAPGTAQSGPGASQPMGGFDHG